MGRERRGWKSWGFGCGDAEGEGVFICRED